MSGVAARVQLWPVLSTCGRSCPVFKTALGCDDGDASTNRTPHTMQKFLTATCAIAAVLGFVLGTAYGAKTPVVNSLAAKLPGSKVAA